MPAYLGVGRLQRYAVGWHGGDHSQPLVIAIPTDTVGRLAQAPKRLPYAAVTSTDRPTHLPPRPRRTARPCLAALRTAKQGVFHDPNDHQFLGPRPHSQKTALPDSRSQVDTTGRSYAHPGRLERRSEPEAKRSRLPGSSACVRCALLVGRSRSRRHTRRRRLRSAGPAHGGTRS